MLFALAGGAVQRALKGMKVISDMDDWIQMMEKQTNMKVVRFRQEMHKDSKRYLDQFFQKTFRKSHNQPKG